jgi:hypothetical protein
MIRGEEMNIKILSIESSEQPHQYSVNVAMGEEKRTFLVKVKPLKGENKIGSFVEINSDMLKFLDYEHGFNTPILKAVGQFDKGIELSFPILLDEPKDARD